MRQLIIIFGLLAFIMLGTRSIATATPVTWCVNISITDTCMGGKYTGDYCVQLELFFNGNSVCRATNCTVSSSGGCCTFSCDFAPVSTTKGYSVTVLYAARYPSGNCATSGQFSSDYWWTDMLCSNCNCQLSIIF